MAAYQEFLVFEKDGYPNPSYNGRVLLRSAISDSGKYGDMARKAKEIAKTRGEYSWF